MVANDPTQLDAGGPSQSPLIPYSTPTAAQTVLTIPELLNEIFCYLPPSSLLLSATKVCRMWHDVISYPSPDLEVALFLRPMSHSRKFEDITFNDTLFNILPENCNEPPNIHVHKGLDVSILPWDINRQAWNHPKALWKKMLLSQTSCTNLKIGETLYSSKSLPSISGSSTEISQAGGITAGTLYDIIEEWKEKQKHPRVQRDIARLEVLKEKGHGWDRRILSFGDGETGKGKGRFWISLKIRCEDCGNEGEEEEKKDFEVVGGPSTFWAYVRRKIGF